MISRGGMTPPKSPNIAGPSPRPIRRRTTRACHRCRIKKTKCYGDTPCERCRADNTICAFGQRKEVANRAYPKGYVEMLEKQHSWLVHGLHVLYQKVYDSGSWPGEPLECSEKGRPLTHDLLATLVSLEPTNGKLVGGTAGATRPIVSGVQEGDLQHPDGFNSYSESGISQPECSDPNPQDSLSSPSSCRSRTGRMRPEIGTALSWSTPDAINPAILHDLPLWPSGGFIACDELDLPLDDGYISHVPFPDIELLSPTGDDLFLAQWSSTKAMEAFSEYEIRWQICMQGAGCTS